MGKKKKNKGKKKRRNCIFCIHQTCYFNAKGLESPAFPPLESLALKTKLQAETSTFS